VNVLELTVPLRPAKIALAPPAPDAEHPVNVLDVTVSGSAPGFAPPFDSIAPELPSYPPVQSMNLLDVTVTGPQFQKEIAPLPPPPPEHPVNVLDTTVSVPPGPPT